MAISKKNPYGKKALFLFSQLSYPLAEQVDEEYAQRRPQREGGGGGDGGRTRGEEAGPPAKLGGEAGGHFLEVERRIPDFFCLKMDDCD